MLPSLHPQGLPPAPGVKPTPPGVSAFKAPGDLVSFPSSLQLGAGSATLFPLPAQPCASFRIQFKHPLSGKPSPFASSLGFPWSKANPLDTALLPLMALSPLYWQDLASEKHTTLLPGF